MRTSIKRLTLIILLAMAAIVLYGAMATGIVVGARSLFSDIDEPLWSWQARSELKDAIGFLPDEAKLLYSWRSCCRRSEPFGGESPGSICVVYQLGNNEFSKLYARQYPKVDWGSIRTHCLGSGMGKIPMKGCKGFSPSPPLPKYLNAQLHGETCSAGTGTRLHIDLESRIVMVERYFYE